MITKNFTKKLTAKHNACYASLKQTVVGTQFMLSGFYKHAKVKRGLQLVTADLF